MTSALEECNPPGWSSRVIRLETAAERDSRSVDIGRSGRIAEWSMTTAEPVSMIMLSESGTMKRL